MILTCANMDIDLAADMPVVNILDPFIKDRNISLQVLRLDTVHPVISGNKWFKLKENIRIAQSLQCSSILTFGGAYSNHLVATAAAANYHNFQSIGIVRGLHTAAKLTPTLEQCKDYGMDLHFVAREDYDRKYDIDYLHTLEKQFFNAYIIPEGGNNEAGMKGAAEIAGYIPKDADIVALAIGTGTTFCGLRNALPEHVSMLGFTAMKGGDYLLDTIQQKTTTGNWQLATQYHFGGFAKKDNTLIDFMNRFYRQHRIPLDFVYTAKAMYGILDMIDKNHIPGNTKILMVHTGGLQGNNSIRDLLQY